MIYDVIIIGAGASGLLSGVLLGRQGLNVLLIDKNETPGRKLGATGNGRCNFTNENMDESWFYYDNSQVFQSCLNHFGYEESLALFESLGIMPYTNKEGYCYPHTNQAQTMVDTLISLCQTYKVKIKTRETITKIAQGETYEVTTAGDYTYYGRYVIVATGGKAYPELGGSEDGYQLIKQLNLPLTPFAPGLTGISFKDKNRYLKLAGVRVRGKITLQAQEYTGDSQYGELQFTKDGLSGIPVFQLSHEFSTITSKPVKAVLDFFPEYSQDDLLKYATANPLGIQGLIPKKLASYIPDIQTAKNFVVELGDSFGFKHCQVTIGGVPLDCVTANMEVKTAKGLYLCGEVLNVDGKCGGYNLQWAFATAVTATQHIIEKEDKL